MAYDEILAAEVDAESPQDENLWNKVKGNFEDHESRIGDAFNVYGDGSDSSFSSSGSGNISAGIYRYTTFELNNTHTLTVNNGKVVVIFATTSIVIDGTLSVDGLGASGGAATPTSGSNGQAATGGGGGGGSSGVGATSGSTEYYTNIVGGSSGGAVDTVGGAGASHPVSNTPYGMEMVRIGSGGGGGGLGASGTPGAGGNGGGCIILIAPTITIGATGVVTADGANGAPGGSANNGGGGGGGGGSVVALTGTYSNSGSVAANGGAGGAGNGSGGNGGVGGAGNVDIVEF